MRQGKLNSEQIRHADEARKNIARISAWTELDGGDAYWRVVHSRLLAMATHGTTDGKPYVEPQPEIGDGYRRATEADAWRKDVEYFSNLKGNGWFPRAVHGKPLESSYLYRVPIDRIPTDEDAVGRPIVMVSDASGSMCKWHPATLLAVLKNCYLGTYESGAAFGGWLYPIGFSTWAYARFPYPGELD